MARTFRRPSKSNFRFHGAKYVRDGSWTRVSKGCENSGSCPWCIGNRLFNTTKRKLKGTDE